MGKKESARKRKNSCGRSFERELLLLFLRGRRRSSLLGSLGLRHTLLEFVHASGGVHKLLRSRVERMAGVADTDEDGRASGTCMDHVAASATDLRFQILWMYISFHKARRGTVPIRAWKTRGFSNFFEESASWISGSVHEISCQSMAHGLSPCCKAKGFTPPRPGSFGDTDVQRIGVSDSRLREAMMWSTLLGHCRNLLAVGVWKRG